MPDKDKISELKEKLAAIEHERWADWQKWMHKCASLDWDAQGNTIYCYTEEQIARWDEQIATPYSELSDREKAADREQVDRYWPLITQLLLEERLKTALRYQTLVKKDIKDFVERRFDIPSNRTYAWRNILIKSNEYIQRLEAALKENKDE